MGSLWGPYEVFKQHLQIHTIGLKNKQRWIENPWKHALCEFEGASTKISYCYSGSSSWISFISFSRDSSPFEPLANLNLKSAMTKVGLSEPGQVLYMYFTPLCLCNSMIERFFVILFKKKKNPNQISCCYRSFLLHSLQMAPIIWTKFWLNPIKINEFILVIRVA